MIKPNIHNPGLKSWFSLNYKLLLSLADAIPSTLPLDPRASVDER